MTNVSGGNATETTDLKDREWAAQFNNLNKILDKYLASSKTGPLSTSQEISTQLANKPNTELTSSPNPQKISIYSEKPSTVSSYNSTLKSWKLSPKNPSINSTSDATNKRHIRANSATSSKAFKSVSRLKTQPELFGSKKFSPTSLEKQQTEEVLKASPDRLSSKVYRPNTQGRSPQKTTQGALTNEIISYRQMHLDYGPRDRPRYGQASSPSRSLQKDDISHILGTPPSLKATLSYNLPFFSNSAHSKKIPHPSEPQKYDHSQIKKRLISNIAQSESLNQTPPSISQQGYWMSAQKSSKNSGINQSTQDIVPRNLSGVKSTSESTKLNKYRSLSASNGYGNALSAHKFALSPNTNKHVFSPVSQYQTISSFISPNSTTPEGDVKYFRAPIRSRVEVPLTSAEKIATVPTINPPDTLRNSSVSLEIKRKKSTENLVEENLQKFERSTILQKIGEDQVAGIEQYHSFLWNTQEIEAKAKEIVQTTLRNKLTSQRSSTLGTSAKERGSTESNPKSTGSDLVYEIAEEKYFDGSKYEGEKQFGKRHGQGIFYYKDGFKYDGQWENGFMKGYGTLWLNETKIYEGEWLDSAFDGRGTAYNHEVSMNVEFDGTDFKLLKNGWVKFEGLFYLGAKQGLGTLHIANGDVYVGNFESDVVHGRGSYTAKDNKAFIGLWKENSLVEKF